MEILDFVCSKGEFLGRGTATTLALRGAGKGKFTAFCGSRSLNISVDLILTLFVGVFEVALDLLLLLGLLDLLLPLVSKFFSTFESTLSFNFLLDKIVRSASFI
jgi:hypothetical protein